MENYTENLDVRVISYNVPVYWKNKFVGVIGIEIAWETLAHEVENIKLFDSGYAFLLDADSNIIYHPEIVGVVILYFTRHLTKPLRELTETAKQVNGDNDESRTDYRKKDEISILKSSLAHLDHNGPGFEKQFQI